MAPRKSQPYAWLLASAALVAGCPNAGTAPPVDASPSTAASAAATAAPASTSPSAAPTAAASTPAASGSAAPSPKPTVSAPAPKGATVTVNGAVYNEEGAKLDGVLIEAKSLTSGVPFTATVTTTSGHYVINGVPVGAQIQFVASKAGHTTRSVVESFQENDTNAKSVNFGNTSATGANAAFFLSDYPELVSATAGDSTKGQKLSYVLKFSEAFDETNRIRIEDAVSVSATPRKGTATQIVIKKGSTFLDASKRLAFAWNTAGDTLTLTFDAPMQALSDDDKAYSVGFTRNSGAEVIKDMNSKTFGFVAPTASQPYASISKKSNLALESTDTTAQKRWEATHSRTSSYDVVKDDVRPKMTGITSSTVTLSSGTFLRLEVAFDEPMVVYPDATGFSSTLTDRNNYSFVFSKKTDGTKGIDMDKTPTDLNDAATTLAALTTRMDNESLFRLVGTTTATTVSISKSNSDPKVIYVDIPKNLIPSDLKVVRVRIAPDVLDPAGNRLSESGKNADTLAQDNVKDAII